jgi:hypothetical protein
VLLGLAQLPPAVEPVGGDELLTSFEP